METQSDMSESQPEIDLEARLREMDDESRARDTSRVAILETRKSTAGMTGAVDVLKLILEIAKSKADLLEQRAMQTEQVAQRTEEAARTTRKAVYGLAVAFVLLLGLTMSSLYLAMLARSDINTSNTAIAARLEEIKNLGVTVSVARYESEPFDSGSSSCTIQHSGNHPCECLREFPAPNSEPKAECRPMAEVAAANADAAVVIATGGHDDERLGSSLKKTCGSNNCLAKTRALVVSDAFESSLAEARRGFANPPHPFPLTRYITDVRGGESNTGELEADRTVVLTLVRTSTTR